MGKSPVPLFDIGEFIVATVNIELTDEMVVKFEESILKKIEKNHPKGLIIDVSYVEVIDSFFARSLINIGRAAKCLGCDTVIVGITPEVALTLTEMGLEWKGIKTSLNVKSAMEVLNDERYGKN